MIPEQLLQQFKWEAEGWKRQLDFMQWENASVKSRIAEIASEEFPGELLPEIEKFQSSSVEEDYTIIQYRRYLEVFINELNSSASQGFDIANIIKKQGQIRDNMDFLEHGFKKFKMEFNQSMLNRL